MSLPKHIAFRRATDEREVVLVKGGRLAYIWLGQTIDGRLHTATLTGEATLRALAHAILAEVDRPKRKGGRPRVGKGARRG